MSSGPKIHIPDHPDPRYRKGHYCFDVGVALDGQEETETPQVWAGSKAEAEHGVIEVITSAIDLDAEGNPTGLNLPPDASAITVVSVSDPYVPELPYWAR